MTLEETKLAHKVRVAEAIVEVIRALGSVPSGHLYARLMGALSLDEYNSAIAALERAELIRNQNHLLTWVSN